MMNRGSKGVASAGPGQGGASGPLVSATRATRCEQVQPAGKLCATGWTGRQGIDSHCRPPRHEQQQRHLVLPRPDTHTVVCRRNIFHGIGGRFHFPAIRVQLYHPAGWRAPRRKGPDHIYFAPPAPPAAAPAFDMASSTRLDSGRLPYAVPRRAGRDILPAGSPVSDKSPRAATASAGLAGVWLGA